MWGFQEIRNEAIKTLSDISKIDTVERVLLGREHNIPKWIIDGYSKLIQREQKLSRAEASALGFETAWLLTDIRESTFVKMGKRWHGRRLDTIETDICITFRSELEDAGYSVDEPALLRNLLMRQVAEGEEYLGP